MTKVTLTIKNADGSIYWIDRFESKDDAVAWVAEEKTRTYWKKDFIVEFDDKTAEVEAAEKAQQDKAAEDTKKKEVLRTTLVALRAKKNKTMADAVSALEAIIDYLGIDLT